MPSVDDLTKRFWWPSWACGVVLAWVAFFLGIVTIGRIVDDPSIENAADFVLAVATPMVLIVVVPCLWLAVGLWDLLVGAAGKSREANTKQRLLSTPASFAVSVVLGTSALYAVNPLIENVLAGVVIHFAAGLLSVGLYLPFSFAVTLVWLCGHVKSSWGTAALVTLSTLCVFAGSLLGIALGAHGA